MCEIPKEINIHFKLFGINLIDYKFTETCEICNSYIDLDGLCSCGSGSD